jgi:hypothetical protein
VETIPTFVRRSRGVLNYLSKPLQPPLAKGRNNPPLWQRGVRGDFQVNIYSIMRPLINQL